MPIRVEDFKAQFIDTLTNTTVDPYRAELTELLTIPPRDNTVEGDAETQRIGQKVRELLIKHKHISLPLLNELSDDETQLSDKDAATIYNLLVEKYLEILRERIQEDIAKNGDATLVSGILNAENDDELKTFLCQNQKNEKVIYFIQKIAANPANLEAIRETAREKTRELGRNAVLRAINTRITKPLDIADSTTLMFPIIKSRDNRALQDTITHTPNKPFFGIENLPNEGLKFTPEDFKKIRKAVKAKASEMTSITLMEAIEADLFGDAIEDIARYPYNRDDLIAKILAVKERINMGPPIDAKFFLSTLTDEQIVEIHDAARLKNEERIAAIPNDGYEILAERIANLDYFNDLIFITLAAADNDDKLEVIRAENGLTDLEEAGEIKKLAFEKRNQLFAKRVKESIAHETNPNNATLRELDSNIDHPDRNLAVILSNKEELFDQLDKGITVDKDQIKFTDEQLLSFSKTATAQLVLIKAMQKLDHSQSIAADDVAYVLGIAGDLADELSPDVVKSVKDRLKERKNAFGFTEVDAEDAAKIDKAIDNLVEPQVRKLMQRLVLRQAIDNADPDVLAELKKARSPEEIRDIIAKEMPDIAYKLGLKCNDADADPDADTNADRDADADADRDADADADADRDANANADANPDIHNQDIISDELARDLKYHAIKKLNASQNISENITQREINAQKLLASLKIEEIVGAAQFTVARFDSVSYQCSTAVKRATEAMGSFGRAERVPKLKDELTKVYNLMIAAREGNQMRIEAEEQEPKKSLETIKILKGRIAVLDEGIQQVHEALDILEQPIEDNKLKLKIAGDKSEVFDQPDLIARDQAVDAKINELLMANGLNPANSSPMTTVKTRGHIVDPTTKPSIVTEIDMDNTNLVCAHRVKNGNYIAEIYGDPTAFKQEGSFLSRFADKISGAITSGVTDKDIRAATTIVDNLMKLENFNDELELTGKPPIGLAKAIALYCKVQGYPLVTSYRPTQAEVEALNQKLEAHPEKYFISRQRTLPSKKLQMEMKQVSEYPLRTPGRGGRGGSSG